MIETNIWVNQQLLAWGVFTLISRWRVASCLWHDARTINNEFSP